MGIFPKVRKITSETDKCLISLFEVQVSYAVPPYFLAK